MNVTCIKKSELNKHGFKDFEDWKKQKKSLYIGRNMSFYVKGATKSKWHNPYTVKKYGLKECLKLYEEHIRNSDLWDDLEELEGKELGCWCETNECHGYVLMKLLNEKLDS